jgi:uncharacterized protein (DUF2249 family)
MPGEVLLDMRELEPPEPLERVLEALCNLDSGQRIRMLIQRDPYLLYPILARDGYTHETRCTETGDYEILIWHSKD